MFKDADGKITHMENDMIAFVEGMADAFKGHLPEKARDPFPPKLT